MENSREKIPSSQEVEFTCVRWTVLKIYYLINVTSKLNMSYLSEAGTYLDIHFTYRKF